MSGVNCNPKTALEEMTITKEQYGKAGGILGFHAFQSFAEREVTPEQCHAIGVRLAEEMWGDRFEVVVSTHLNTNHYHNHFVINSVSFKDVKEIKVDENEVMTLKEVKALRKEMARIKEENEILHQRRALAKKAMAIFATRN